MSSRLTSGDPIDEYDVDTVNTIRAALHSPAALAEMQHPVAADCWCRPKVVPVGDVHEIGRLYLHNYGPVA